MLLPDRVGTVSQLVDDVAQQFWGDSYSPKCNPTRRAPPSDPEGSGRS